MITEAEKRILKKHIKKLIRETIEKTMSDGAKNWVDSAKEEEKKMVGSGKQKMPYEIWDQDSSMPMDRKKPMKENYYFEESDKPNRKKNDEKNGNYNSQMRKEVEEWVRSEYQLNSTLAYHLWPDKDEDTARSLFAKKANGQDADGNGYSFSDAEIVKLANIRTQLNESQLKKIIKKSIKKVLKEGQQRTPIFTLNAIDLTTDEGIDDMQYTSQTYYSEDEAIEAAKEMANKYSDWDGVINIFIMAGEYELPSGEVCGEPDAIYAVSNKDEETTRSAREKSGYTRHDVDGYPNLNESKRKKRMK